MTTLLKPEDPAQVADAVRWAAAEELPLEVLGAGTKRGLGRPVAAGHRLDLAGLTGIEMYEPAELVLTARAGTLLAEIETALAAERQQLAFEPPDYGPLYGAPTGAGTIGGAVACNLSGPRRLKAGAARDHFLGTAAVSGRGEPFKAGGRVVKNVTGYDLCKLLAGSYGTLAVMTQVTLKVLPAPERARTVLVLGLGDEAAVAAMAAALKSPYEVSSSAHLPTSVAEGSGVDYVRDAGTAVTAIRVEGLGVSVEARCDSLRALLSAHGAVEELHSHRSTAFWREVGDAVAFAGGGERALWRLSVPPSASASVAAEIGAARTGRHFYDWGGGLIWLEEGDEAPAAAVHEATARAGGHALLVRAPEATRREGAVFQPQPAGLGALSARVKEGFDPRGILNPGRMYAGV
jgi:glycolate oxidase FAD binding subunit